MELSQDFYAQKAEVVARNLIGKYLVSADGTAGMITETEAYVGAEDKASHASRGRTARTEVMFGPPGVWYVYLCYGVHWMLNVVTDRTEHPAAVLLRGVHSVNGPGRLTKYFGIDKRFNACSAQKTTGLWIEDRGEHIAPSHIQTLPRVGVDYAGEWAQAPLRFFYRA